MEPVAAEQPTAESTAPVEESNSLADHEQAFGPGAERQPATEVESTETASTEQIDGERDPQGRFKPRHRAKSQQASAEDVPRIQELTRKLRETEAERDALRTPPKPAQAVQQTQAAPQQPTPQTAAYPDFTTWQAHPANAERSYEDYLDDRADYRQFLRDQQTYRAREQQEHQTRVQAHQQKLTDARAKYADFDQVVTGTNQPVTDVMAQAILASDQSRDIEYFLGKHPDVLQQLFDETVQSHPSVIPVLRRHLETLVAREQRADLKPAPVAASTGSALALVTPPAPRPPNPVRTGPMKTGDELPGDDDMSISNHEKAFGGRRR